MIKCIKSVKVVETGTDHAEPKAKATTDYLGSPSTARFYTSVPCRLKHRPNDLIDVNLSILSKAKRSSLALGG